MNIYSWLQLIFYLVVLIALAKPLGAFMARVYQGERTFLDPLLRPVEKLIYRLSGVNPDEEMNWKVYAIAMLLFNGLGLLVVYALQRLQGFLPLNPQGFGAVSPDSSWNTAVSFATNTNWQGYGGETTMSYLTQMLGLTVQNFVSAATGMAILIAMIRGIARHTAKTIGNFWVDLTRTTLYILLPLSFVLALLLVSQGVVQTFSQYKTAALLQPTTDANGNAVTQQVLAVGPAASQIAIKQLGTNGGGFFNANSAHPFENPTPFSNFLEMLSILLIPAALCYTFGKMVGDTRQGWAILAAMTIIFVVLLSVTVWAEQTGNPAIASLGVDIKQSNHQPGREHGRQGSALRRGQLGPVGHRHDRRFQRLGQLDARFVHATGRHDPAVADALGRGHLRRGRLRAVRHAGLRHRGRLRGRADGRAHARIPGQEDRSLRDEDGLADPADPGLHCPGRHRHRR